MLPVFKTLTLCLLLMPMLAIGQMNPFETLDYDRVVAYEFQGDGEWFIETCLTEAQEKIHKTLELTVSQTKEIETILTSKKAYGNTTMFCFDPHFAMVYYKGETIVGSINICLACNYLIASETIPSSELKMIRISDDYAYPAKGFSKNTRKEIYEFIKSLGFTKYLEPLVSRFDD